MKKQRTSAQGLPAWLDARTVAVIGTVCTVGLGVAATNLASMSALRLHCPLPPENETPHHPADAAQGPTRGSVPATPDAPGGARLSVVGATLVVARA